MPRSHLVVLVSLGMILLFTLLAFVRTRQKTTSPKADTPLDDWLPAPSAWIPLPPSFASFGGDLMETELGIEVRIAAVPFEITPHIRCSPTPDDQLPRVVAALTQELRLYTREALERGKVKRVLLCQGLSVGDVRGLAGLAAFRYRTLMVDTAHPLDTNRWAIHHEVFHLIDTELATTSSITSWSQLNPVSFAYNADTPGIYGQLRGGVDPTLFGFLTRYSMNSVQEDRAEVFAGLVVDPKGVADFASRDSILAAKVTRLKQELETFDIGLATALAHLACAVGLFGSGGWWVHGRHDNFVHGSRTDDLVLGRAVVGDEQREHA